MHITRISYKFETQPCARCGGSGRYSYCQMHGDKCFGCWGSGNARTPAAKRSLKSIDRHRETQIPKIPASEVRVGMSILWNGVGTPSWRRVIEIWPSYRSGGSRVDVITDNDTHQCGAAMLVRVNATTEQLEAFAAKVSRIRTGVVITAHYSDGTTAQINTQS